jgi:hypothetical protein
VPAPKSEVGAPGFWLPLPALPPSVGAPLPVVLGCATTVSLPSPLAPQPEPSPQSSPNASPNRPSENFAQLRICRGITPDQKASVHLGMQLKMCANARRKLETISVQIAAVSAKRFPGGLTEPVLSTTLLWRHCAI